MTKSDYALFVLAVLMGGAIVVLALAVTDKRPPSDRSGPPRIELEDMELTNYGSETTAMKSSSSVTSQSNASDR